MMNTRIKELAEQSGLDIYGLGLDRNKWDTTVSKFAELIVRECAEIAKTAAPYSSDDLILKRFGFDNE
jgi:hypothetical protein